MRLLDPRSIRARSALDPRASHGHFKCIWAELVSPSAAGDSAIHARVSGHLVTLTKYLTSSMEVQASGVIAARCAHTREPAFGE